MLDAIVPRGVHVAESFGDARDDAVLFPAEEAAVARAGPKRRAEFVAVRACARRALTSAGFEPGPVPRASSGAPVWPAGVVGSMTHCDGYRACAVGRADAYTAIGIDAEPHAPLPDGVLAMVAGQRERAALAALAAAVPGTCWAKILFSAKEAVFKAWWPATGRWLGFADAEVELHVGGTFTARVVSGPAAGYRGRWTAAQGLIATAIVVPLSRP